MANFSITTNAEQDAGIAAAAAAYNAALPEVMDGAKPPAPISPKPGILTDEEYYTARCLGTADSYAEQYHTSAAAQEQAKNEYLETVPPEKQADVEAAIDGVLTKP